MNKKGFTLIELLVVVAIIGLLATLSIVALNSARARSRDAKRVADIKQVQTALELYFNDFGQYPATVATSISGTPTGASSTFYMNVVPIGPIPADGGCATSSYVYKSDDSNRSYSLSYCLGAATGGIPSGANKATPAGIR